MKTAQGQIKIDTSLFDKAIDTSKEKLASLASMIKKLVTAILGIVAVYKVFSEFKEKIQMVANVVKYLSKIFNENGSIAKRIFEDIKVAIKESIEEIKDSFKTLKEYGTKAWDSIKSKNESLPPVLNSTNSKFKDIISQIKYFSAGAVLMGTTFTLISGSISLVGTIIQKVFSGIFSAFSMVVNFIKSAVVGAFNVLVSTIKGVAVGAVAIGTAFVGLSAVIARGVVGVFEMGDELKRMRDITGASIPFLMSLQKAFKQNGMTADDVIPVLSEMNRSISEVDEKGQPSNKALKQLGINIKSLQGVSTEERFLNLAMAISQIGDSGLKTQYAMDLFGKHGRYVLSILSDQSALKNFGKNMDAASATMAEQADRFARISAKLKDTGTTFRGFFTQIAGAVAPQLETLLDMLSKGDIFTPIGTKIGEALRYGLNVFVASIQQGKITESLKNALTIPLIYFNSYFSRSISTIEKIFSIITSPRKLNILFMDMPAKSMLGDIGSSLASLFKSVAKLFAVAFLDAMQVPIAVMQIAFDRMAIGFAFALAKNIATAFGAFAKINPLLKQLGFGDLGSVVEDLFVKMSGGLKQSKFSDLVKEQVSKNKKEGVLDFGLGTIDDAIQGVSFSIKDTISSIREVIDVSVKQFKNMEGMSDSDKKKLESLQKYFDELNKIGEDIAKKTEATPLTTPFTPKYEPLKTSMAQEAVSSLQKIGGGGGAFTGYDPLLKQAENQTNLQKEMVTELKKQNSKTEKGGGLMATTLEGVFG